MTLLERAGLALYGSECWRSQLRADLELHPRTFRRMVQDDGAVPAGVRRDVEQILRDRVLALDALLLELVD